MPISITRTGTITGISAGGLPDDCITTAEIAGSAVTTAKLAQPLTLATGQNATGTSIDFTGIPSWVKRVTVMFNEISLTSIQGLLVQIGDSGGIEASGYVSTSNALDNVGSSASSNSTAGFAWASTGAVSLFTGLMRIVNVSGNLWVSDHAGKADTIRAIHGGGSKTLSDVLDRIRLTGLSGGTFNGGSVNIMYEG
jgi:hypothetical protein